MDIDKNLWIKISHECSGPHYLVGNPHTFPGRITAFCEERNKTIIISRNEIVEMSDESKYWVEGFLIGNEPPPPIELDNQRPEDYYSSKDYLAWLKRIKDFKKTGQWD